jgi:methionine-rich copper-binding protein CopC
MTARTRVRRPAAFVLATGPGLGHAALFKSIPAQRAALTQAPGRVRLWFNEHSSPRPPAPPWTGRDAG